MGRQARLKRERSKARQDQALPVVDEWRDMPAPTGNGATVYVKCMGATFTDTPRRDTQGGVWLPTYASQTTDDSGMYATVTREPSNSRTDDPSRRAAQAAYHERAAQEPTTFTPNNPQGAHSAQDRPDAQGRSPARSRLALAQVFTHGLMLLADAVDAPRTRAHIPTCTTTIYII
jgi:hypothetical protein